MTAAMCVGVVLQTRQERKCGCASAMRELRQHLQHQLFFRLGSTATSPPCLYF
jgi:hypothetical protein